MRIYALTIYLVLALTACGGGSEANTAADTVAISANNMSDVATEAINASSLGFGARASVMSSDARVAELIPSNVSPKNELHELLKSIDQQVPGLLTQTKSPQVQPMQIVGQTYACNYGGTYAISINDADSSSSLTSGDTVTLSFNNCHDAYTNLSKNGSISVYYATINGYNGSNTNYSLKATASYSTYRLSIDGTLAQLTRNGSISVNLASTSTYSASDTVSIPNMSVTIRGSDGVTTMRSWSNFTSSQITSPNATTVYQDLLTVNGTVTSGALANKSIYYVTASPFLIYAGNANPSSGQLIVTGKLGSKLRLSILSNMLYQIDLDANGDNVYETSMQRSF